MRALAGAAKAAAALSLTLAAVTSAEAASSPAIKIAAKNAVPECATPGRLMAYLGNRNKSVPPHFENVATEYMRQGEALGVRWDYAFFQMIVETGALSFTGDVKADQFNLAGLGATGNGEHGERFPDLASGVRAHLQHLLMYAGDKVENPVAERTRKVQEWGVLTKWQASFEKPITFADLAAQWAPGSRRYARDLTAVADGFYDSTCKGADPRPELVAEARKGRTGKVAKSVTTDGEETQRGKGAEVASKSVAEARAAEGAKKTTLGAGELAKVAEATSEANRATPGPEVKILNPNADEKSKAEVDDAKGKVETASLAAGAKAGAAAAIPGCRVWTASYGGSKAIVIKAKTGETINYTVLDVNEGSEKAETQAYITAYAKGGEMIGEFASREGALDKAFEICPEG